MCSLKKRGRIMPTKLVFRRRYLIKKGLQFRYIGIVFALVILASIVTGYTVFATGWTLLGEKLASVYPQSRLIYVFKAVNMALIRNLLAVSPFIFILALLFSHRIAGPLYRLEKILDEIARGNLALQIKLRRGDELQDLAEIINVMTGNLKKTIVLSKETSLSIQKELQGLKDIITYQPIDLTKLESSINNLQAKINELNSSLRPWST
jgi:methyl-accepting chemotaxis protein